MQAANVVSQQILPQSGQLGAIGAQTFDAATAQQYMNPYENQVIQSALTDVHKRLSRSTKKFSYKCDRIRSFWWRT
jgi:hypothetical protein